MLRRALTFALLSPLIYLSCLLLLTHPTIQRHAFYANLVNPSHIQHPSSVEQFGFFRHQVLPFSVRTTDGQDIYVWHILPTELYLRHERDLRAQPGFGDEAPLRNVSLAAETVNLGLLRDDPTAQVVVSFHGNAGHVGSSWRPVTNRAMLGLSRPGRRVHVFAFDYRGFGLSSGAPEEEGIVEDGMAILRFLTGHGRGATEGKGAGLGVEPGRITLLGQSMGTATATGLYHRWVYGLGLPELRGMVLMASFTSLPSLVGQYSFKGLTPRVFAPIRWVPRLERWIHESIVDRWETGARLKDLVGLKEGQLRLTILHASNDGDIPWREGWRNWQSAVDGGGGIGRVQTDIAAEDEEGLEVLVWESEDGRKMVRWERIMKGAHNHVATSEQAKVAVLRILDEDGM